MIYINYNWKHIDNTYKMTCILIYISIFYILYTRNELHEDGADWIEINFNNSKHDVPDVDAPSFPLAKIARH